MRIHLCLTCIVLTPVMIFAQNVGIGTSTPAYKMHVTGGDLFVQSSTGSIILGYDGSNKWHWSTTNGGADLRMISDDGAATTPRHYFSQNGNVGISGFSDATVPAVPLHVRSTVSEILRIQGSNPFLSMHDNTDGYRGFFWYNGTDMVLGATTGVSLRFTSGGLFRMTVNSDGRVSIGSANTTATGYLLSVDGKIICEEARVQISTSWPDYVFADNYRLRPIESLEQYINEKKQLPNIPSATQVEKEGIELGDMNKRLLEKIEELTLYIIQLNKENRDLKTRIGKIEASVKH